MSTILIDIDKAIKNKNVIKFEYNGFARTVHPYHYGVLGNDEQLHGYQIEGGSRTGGIPDWRNFKIEDIKDLEIVDSNFSLSSAYKSSSAYSKIVKSVT